MAKGFDFLVGKFGQVPDDITEYLYFHVLDIVNDGIPVQWPGSGPERASGVNISPRVFSGDLFR